ncbi:hypothetical protein [Sphingomonas prati]|uniref:Uncharacterized protein n=1 Tax=Sphingomonas prati TaxID=1843237 RepID=A0A7W9BPU8_9SPHN|nr:hypothetical protein [Sphingomonas prati]MBB5727971.1 hypothetical protein [Sphingomonas prati]
MTIATMNGRYDSITPTSPPDCRKPANARPVTDYSDRPAYRPDRPSAARDDDQPVVDGQPVSLGLVCFGDGSRDGIASGTSWTWNSRRDRYEYGRYNETRKEQFDASLTVQTWDGGGRIRLPKSLVPPLNSRGSDGWWDLSDVVVEPDTIRATYRLNGLNKPKVVIDRRTGRITVKGFSDYGFRGTCDTIGHEPRRF